MVRSGFCFVRDIILWLHVIVCFVTVNSVVENDGKTFQTVVRCVCVCVLLSNSSEIHVPFCTDSFCVFFS